MFIKKKKYSGNPAANGIFQQDKDVDKRQRHRQNVSWRGGRHQ